MAPDINVDESQISFIGALSLLKLDCCVIRIENDLKLCSVLEMTRLKQELNNFPPVVVLLHSCLHYKLLLIISVNESSLSSSCGMLRTNCWHPECIEYLSISSYSFSSSVGEKRWSFQLGQSTLNKGYFSTWCWYRDGCVTRWEGWMKELWSDPTTPSGLRLRASRAEYYPSDWVK